MIHTKNHNQLSFIDNDFSSLLLKHTTKALAEAFNVDLTKQRIDSVHIRSNMKNLGHIALFSRTIHKFLVNLKRQHRSLYDHLSDDLVSRYLKKKGTDSLFNGQAKRINQNTRQVRQRPVQPGGTIQKQ